MVKSKLITKKPKKMMNPMEAYRKKNKDKERAKMKKDRFGHKDARNKGEESKQQYSNVPPPAGHHQNNDDDDDDFEGQDDLMELNSEAVQKILQAKQNMREKRYDDVSVQSSIQDLMQTFGKKQPAPTKTAHPVSQSAHSHQAASRMEYPAEHNKPVFLPSAVSQQPQSTVKTAVGDKRLQKRQGADGSIDPFMMTTMQGDYNPTIKNKQKQSEEGPTFDPMTGSYHSSAPGAYKAVQTTVVQKPVNTGPVVIMKEAALTSSAPLRSQMEKEKASLIPVNVVRKKVTKVETEPQNTPIQPTTGMGIQNVTNVPAPQTKFAFTPSIQQNTAHNDQLSAFLSEISKLDE